MKVRRKQGEKASNSWACTVQRARLAGSQIAPAAKKGWRLGSTAEAESDATRPRFFIAGARGTIPVTDPSGNEDPFPPRRRNLTELACGGGHSLQPTMESGFAYHRDSWISGGDTVRRLCHRDRAA